MNDTNRIKTKLPDAVFNNLVSMIGGMESELAPYMVDISMEERIAMPKINVDNKVFVEDAIDAMENVDAAQFIPNFLTPAACKGDLIMFEQMNALMSRLSNLVDKMDSTRMLAGSEAYTAALAFKKLADAAASSNVYGATEISRKIAERFKSNGNRSGSADSKTATEE